MFRRIILGIMIAFIVIAVSPEGKVIYNQISEKVSYEKIKESSINNIVERNNTPDKMEESITAAENMEVFRLINEEREANGLSPLEYRYDLQSIADTRAREQLEIFGHTRPDGSSWETSVDKTWIWYKAIGENLAGKSSASVAVNSWMNSPGHRGNILKEEYTGTAICAIPWQGYGYAFVQIFIG